MNIQNTLNFTTSRPLWFCSCCLNFNETDTSLLCFADKSCPGHNPDCCRSSRNHISQVETKNNSLDSLSSSDWWAGIDCVSQWRGNNKATCKLWKHIIWIRTFLYCKLCVLHQCKAQMHMHTCKPCSSPAGIATFSRET